MIFKNRLRFIIFIISLIQIVSCGKVEINRYKPPSGTVDILPAYATITTPLTMNISGGNLSLIVKNTRTSDGCTYNAGGSNSSNVSTSFASTEPFVNTTDRQAMIFTNSVKIYVNQVTLRIKKAGGPSGNIYVQLRNLSGSDPGTLIASSSQILANSVPNENNDGNLMTFSFATPVELTAGQHALVLVPHTDYSADIPNSIRWVNNSAAAGCSGFSAYSVSADSGTTWGAGSSGGTKRGFFTIDASNFETPGIATWILAAEETVSWKMSKFTMSENPDGYSGSVSYDVGAGSSATVATYTSSNLGIAEVQALGALSGQYLYLKATLGAGASLINKATLGSGSIKY